jgi:LuxR family transcriptional regulator, maltose regulon positive regulatory protein
MTHLTFAEISERLYVSPHAVKTQAISVYRKLGASSRGQAVQRAQQLGLGG